MEVDLWVDQCISRCNVINVGGTKEEEAKE